MILNFLFVFLFGVREVASVCPQLDFGYDTGGGVFIFLYENGSLSRTDQTQNIPKADVEREYLQSLRLSLLYVLSDRDIVCPGGARQHLLSVPDRQHRL